MKKVMVALVLVAACHRTVATSPTPSASAAASQSQAGAADAASAVRAFLAAAHDQDLQAMGAAWGTPAGGAVRDQLPRDEMEKRELIMLKCLQHDSYEILTNSPSTAGTRLLAVQLKRRNLSHAWNFTAVAGPNNRWYVENFNMDLADAFCRS